MNIKKTAYQDVSGNPGASPGVKQTQQTTHRSVAPGRVLWANAALSRLSGLVSKLLPVAVAVFLGLSTQAFAQAPFPPPESGISVLYEYREVKAYMNLNDDQMKLLQDAQTQRFEAGQAIYSQIGEKESELGALINAGTNDATRVGQLVLEINELRKRLPTTAEPYRSSALAVLTPDQKAQLPALENSLRLFVPATQAATLNLIEGPTPLSILHGARQMTVPVPPGPPSVSVMPPLEHNP